METRRMGRGRRGRRLVEWPNPQKLKEEVSIMAKKPKKKPEKKKEKKEEEW